jgi:hypothetical protein
VGDEDAGEWGEAVVVGARADFCLESKGFQVRHCCRHVWMLTRRHLHRVRRRQANLTARDPRKFRDPLKVERQIKSIVL